MFVLSTACDSIPWRPQTMTATATTATNDNGPKISQWHGHMEDYGSHKHWFLADRTNGRAYSPLLRPPSAWRQSVVYLSVVGNVCIAAKRCVLEQKLLLAAQSHIGSRMWGIDWYQNEWPLTLFRGCLRSRRPKPHIRHWIWRKTLEIEAWFQRTTNRKLPMPSRMVMWPTTLRDPKMSNRLVTTKCLDPNISDGLFSTPLPCLTARSGEPVRISGWNLRGKN